MLTHRRSLLLGLLAAPAIIGSARAKETLEQAFPAPRPLANLSQVPIPPGTPIPMDNPGALPRWQRFAVPAPDAEGRPIISLVVDDMGVMHAGTRRAVALEAPVTLAWFPFAHNLAEQVGEATERGHETLLHMPMQSFGNSIAWTGPDPLRIDLPPEENLRRLWAAIDAVPDTVGLNNHMGSVATRDPALMTLVAQEAKRRDMLVLDSLTIGHSMAYRAAAEAGVPAASRDVFVDNVADRAQIAEQLALIETVARRQGHVIAIGHPRPLTLDALEAWVPTLVAKGFAMWPLSATVALRNEIVMPA